MNLYPHQLYILEELRKGKRVIVADPRTMKSRPAIEFFRECEEVVIFTKLNAIGDWYGELEAMGIKGWTVVNHEKLRSKSWDAEKVWDGAIFDEFHVFGSYPKPNQMTKPGWALKVNGERVGISATPCSETYAQLFHSAKVLKLPLWEKYKVFYHWHEAYGIPHSIRAHGRMVPQYNKVLDKAWDEFAEHCVIIDRQEEMPDFVEAEDHLVVLEDESVLEMCKTLKRDGILKVQDRVIIADTPLAVSQKCQQICAGVVLDDEGFPVHVNSTKADWIRKRFLGRKTAILTTFKAEVDTLVKEGSSTGSIRQFQNGEVDWVLGNYRSLNAGINFEVAEAMVITGCPWGFTPYKQGRERLLNRRRVDSAPVYFPVIKGGIDEQIYHRVAVEKQDFHARMYA